MTGYGMFALSLGGENREWKLVPFKSTLLFRSRGFARLPRAPYSKDMI